MLQGDARDMPRESVFTNINVNTIDLNVISEVQKELEIYDLTSLVFLLYDVPDTALQRLIVLQRVSKDIGGNNLNLLYDWALHAQSRMTWREEFVEALSICQLYGVIRKLGIHVPTIKTHYLVNLHSYVYINPIKRVLYQLCENMTSDTFEKFKKALCSYEYNVAQYDMCELVILELICQKFLVISKYNRITREAEEKCHVEEFVKIIERFPSLNEQATLLREIESQMNNKFNLTKPTSSSTPLPKDILNETIDKDTNHTIPHDFQEVFDLFTNLNIEDLNSLESDKKTTMNYDVYQIKNQSRVGICCIINQEEFHPSRVSIMQFNEKSLDKREGSTKDRILLEKTMQDMKFEVLCEDNLGHKSMISFITDSIAKVTKDDSIFMLCILSHGTRGHVYAADSVKVRVEHIQNLLDNTPQLHGIPKVLILQACRVANNNIQASLVADGPVYSLPKMDFLIYWATSPELEAYRHPKFGSIFIQMLCMAIRKFSKHDHMTDVFTKVNNIVAKIFTNLEYNQMPVYKSSLTKKLYLQIPIQK